MLANGSSLAGSAITMLDAFCNLVSLGPPIAVASEMCATRQAEYLGSRAFGEISPGRSASLVVLDRRLGRQIDRRAQVGDAPLDDRTIRPVLRWSASPPVPAGIETVDQTFDRDAAGFLQSIADARQHQDGRRSGHFLARREREIAMQEA